MLNLNDILNKTESLSFSKEVSYTQQQGIIGKASLSAGAENLKIYPLTIKLHYSFCNPNKVIKEIEEKIANCEIIDYFQGSIYIGKYILRNLQVDVLELRDGLISACVINVELLESGEKEENFVQQVVDDAAEGLTNVNNTVAGRAKTFLASSNPVINFVKKQAQNIKEQMIDAAFEVLENGDISSLSDIGRLTAREITDNIVNDIQNAGISNAGKIAEKYTSRLQIPGLSAEEKERLVDALNGIPGKMIDSVLRG